jgi:hypothetical protein
MPHRNVGWMPVLLFVATLAGCASQGGPKTEAEEFAAYLASQTSPEFETARVAKAEAYLKKYPNLSDPIRRGVREGKVVLGMCPEDAHAAGGWCDVSSFVPDPMWDPNAHPLDIALAQRDHPDSSRMKFTFHNRTQFDTDEPMAFTVVFERGRAVRIERPESE